MRLRLVDFASAGARGTRYRSWLPAQPSPPAPSFTRIPHDGARVPVGEARFQRRGRRDKRNVSYRLEFATNETFNPLVWSTNSPGSPLTFDTARLLAAGSSAHDEFASSPGASFYWRVVTVSPTDQTLADVPPAQFTLDPAAPPQPLPPEPHLGPDGELALHSLCGEAPPRFGELKSGQFTLRDVDGTEVNGRSQTLRYVVAPWPEEDFTVAVRVRIRELPLGHIGQVFSAWCAVGDDPLRLVIDGGKLSARMEAGSGFSTPGAAIETGRW